MMRANHECVPSAGSSWRRVGGGPDEAALAESRRPESLLGVEGHGPDGGQMVLQISNPGEIPWHVVARGCW